jgi:hypothetical protein
MMKLNACGARKALVVAVMGCMGTILAAGQHKEQSTARTVAAKKDGRAEIDAHAAEWLKESDVPSAAAMRAKRVMSANLTRTKTEGNRYRVDALPTHYVPTHYVPTHYVPFLATGKPNLS